MRTLMAIDPGCHESAYVILDVDSRRVLDYAKAPNAEVLSILRSGHLYFCLDQLAVETLAGSYGQAVGIETMDTAVWVGRYIEAWECQGYPEAIRIFRKTAVTHVTGNAKASDSHVRQALIDRWGGNSVALARPVVCKECKKQRAKSALWHCGTGLCSSAGPLVGVSKDVWAALAVAVTAADQARSGSEKEA